MNEKFKVIPASEEWTLFSNKQQVESQNEKRMDSTSDYGGPQWCLDVTAPFYMEDWSHRAK